MSKKFTSPNNDQSGFSLIEVLIALLIASIFITSVVDAFRTILQSSIVTKDFEKLVSKVEKFYYSFSPELLDGSEKLMTNYEGIYIEVTPRQVIQEKPKTMLIDIEARYGKLRYSVETVVYE